MANLIDVNTIIDMIMNDGIYCDTDADKECSAQKIRELPTVDAIPKADYENRLKADMVAMLEDLDLQIDESAAYNLEVAKVQRLIRDKINSLKEDKNHDAI